MARRSIWEKLQESTEGPTVTLQIPREWAEELLRALATSLEVEDMGGDGLGDGEMDGMPVPHMEPDEDDLGMGPPDGDADDGLDLFGGGDEDDVPAGDDDSDDEEDDDEDEEKDESAGPYRLQTALGERRSLSSVYGRGRRPAPRSRK